MDRAPHTASTDLPIQPLFVIMNFVQTSPAREAANEISSIITEIIGFNRESLRRIYELVNTPDQQQAILDKFGPSGVEALTAYAALQSAMELVAPGSVPPANAEVFVSQEDGTVLYVAPPIVPPVDAEA
jgi:hypothetical protein